MSELISVIVPVYNVEKYLSECVDSIINQSYTQLEILLVDDGSTDNSSKICDEYAKKDSRVKVIHKTNGGVSSARNIGLDVCAGEYVMFVDSDDYLDENACLMALHYLNSEAADFSFFGLIEEYSSGKTTKQSSFSDKKTFSCESIENLFLLVISDNALKDILGPVCKLFRRSVIGDTRFKCDITIGEDIVFVLEVIEKSKRIVFFPECYYFYRYVDTSLSKRKDNSFVEKIIKLDKAIAQETTKFFGDKFTESMLYGNYVARAGTVEMYYFERYSLREYKTMIFHAKKYFDQPYVVESLKEWQPVSKKKKLLRFLLLHKMYFVLWLLKRVKKGIIGQ